MEIIRTDIEGLLILKPTVFRDERGYFVETYKDSVFRAAGLATAFAQDSQSLSRRGVLRGLHYQIAPHAQVKLVRVARGLVLDVVVDLRRRSPTFKRWYAIELNAEDHTMLWVPEGLAHGFVTLEDDTVLVYKSSRPYDKASERGVRWDDPALAIDWELRRRGIAEPALSARDRALPLLGELGGGDLF